jgi:putative DNA methylase
MATKKLIEVALPLDKINEASAREKSIRHGHPSTLHLWWARRPLAAARAVIWSSLVDDPSSHPELFPTEEDQNRERERLFKILDDLVVWENSNNQKVLDAAKKEILKYNNGEFPTLLDPFAGGGAIPLEAQRLGLKAIAHDLNPVAVMINKAMIEIPPRFANMAPINPEVRRAGINTGWEGAHGLAEDVRYYGEWMKQEAFKRIGHLYPKVKVPKEQGGGEATVIAWIWARTVKCPNPACGCEMPLIHSCVLSKKKGNEAWAEPIYEDGKLTFRVHHSGKPKLEGTIGRKGAVCAKCGSPVNYPYVRQESMEGRMGEKMVAVIAENRSGRIYLEADVEQAKTAKIQKPDDYPVGNLSYYPGHLNTVAYGLDTFDKLFTNRQLTALTTFSDLVSEAQKKAEQDAVLAGMKDDHLALRDGGDGAKAYGEAIRVYLAFAVDRQADIGSSIASWINTLGAIRNTFGRQAIPMTWDFAEGNPFSSSTGCFSNMLQWVSKCVDNFPNVNSEGKASLYNAQEDCGLRNIMISTDPPYYDNIGYADLSDFFYVWMRRSLKDIYPEVLSTLLVPKTEELIATPYRHDGSTEEAKTFFENGMLAACEQIYKYSRDEIPVTIYYAYKQSDSDDAGTASSGWETMLSAIIKAGFFITGTWPMRTERSVRTVAQGTNALASSIVLVCRKRPADAPQTTRRNLIAELRRELRPALKKLQESNIAPVDLAQAAIGPGMSVFSRYRRVLEADGTPMTVREAQRIINEEVDMYFNEKVGNMDTASRFCVDLYTQAAYNDIKYGEAEILANAKGASIPMMASHGILYAKGGNVHLVERKDLPEKAVADNDNIWMLTQQLTRAMEKGGVEACAKIIAPMFGSNAENAKDLAYRLYTIAEQKKWTNEAFAYNALVVAWPDIQSRAAELKAAEPRQMSLFDYDFNEDNK